MCVCRRLARAFIYESAYCLLRLCFPPPPLRPRTAIANAVPTSLWLHFRQTGGTTTATYTSLAKRSEWGVRSRTCPQERAPRGRGDTRRERHSLAKAADRRQKDGRRVDAQSGGAPASGAPSIGVAPFQPLAGNWKTVPLQRPLLPAPSVAFSPSPLIFTISSVLSREE